jgi:hypothetical protein
MNVMQHSYTRLTQERPAIESSKKKRGKQKCVAREAGANQCANAEGENSGRKDGNSKHGKVQKDRNAQQPMKKVTHPGDIASDKVEFAEHEAKPGIVRQKGAEKDADKEKEAMARELQQLKREREAMRDEVLCAVCLNGPKDTALPSLVGTRLVLGAQKHSRYATSVVNKLPFARGSTDSGIVLIRNQELGIKILAAFITVRY